MKGNEKLALIEATEEILYTVEAEAIQRINMGLQASFDNMARKLDQKYPGFATDKMPNLLPHQRAALLMDQILPVVGLLDPERAKVMNKTFRKAIGAAHDQGSEMGKALLGLHLKPSDIQESTAKLPVNAIAAAAQDATGRLSRHGLDFREKATGLIIQGLAQGWGVQRVKGQLMNQLGATKASADMIARTETLAATNSAAIKTYSDQGIRYFQVMATAADRRTCPFCVGRNMAVYQIGKVNQPPFHPRCRCYAMPWEPAWQKAGLVDDKETLSYYLEGVANLKAVGKVPTLALTPFEKLQGLVEPPKPVWAPVELTQDGRAKKVTSEPTPLTVEAIDNLPEGLKLRDIQEIYESIHKGSFDLKGFTTNSLKDSGESESLILYYMGRLTSVFKGKLPPTFKRLIYDRDRAYANDNGVLNVGSKPDGSILYHEMGHHLEYSYPDVAQMARDFLIRRASGEPRKLNELDNTDIYNDNEIAYPDKFIDSYVGKVYQSGHTEVISMGLQHLVSVKGMYEFYKRDPEHFMLTVKAIQGVRNGTFKSIKELAKAGKSQASSSLSEPTFRGLSQGSGDPIKSLQARLQERDIAYQQKAYGLMLRLNRIVQSKSPQTKARLIADYLLEGYGDPEVAELISQFNLKAIVKTPALAKGYVKELRKLFKDTIKENPGLKLVDGNRGLIREIGVGDADTLDNLAKSGRLSPTDLKMLALAKEFQSQSMGINTILDRATNEFEIAGYDDLFENLSNLDKATKSVISRFRDFSDENPGYTPSDPELARYYAAMGRHKIESLPNYKIVVPSSLDEILRNSQKVEC